MQNEAFPLGSVKSLKARETRLAQRKAQATSVAFQEQQRQNAQKVRANKRPFPEENEASVDFEPTQDNWSMPEHCSIPRRNPGSSIPDPLPRLDPDNDDELPPTERFERAKVDKRHASVVVSATKPPRERVPWSSEEDNALIDLIEQYGGGGISWAVLKKTDDAAPGGGKLRLRTAEDMRFKGRDMKVVFLCARKGLPANFDKINLDKKAVEKLQRHGIAYHQERTRGANT